ncbi:cell wall-binding repeat-containing protein [Bacillaceae bacterium S4-13-58]
MKKIRLSILLIFVLFLPTNIFPIQALAEGNGSGDIVVNDRRIMIKVLDVDEFTYNSSIFDKPTDYGVMAENEYLFLRVRDKADYKEALEELKQDPMVLFAEPDYIRILEYIPSDPYYPEQGYLRDINMERAWDFTKGSSETVVAVFDTGVESSHPDLVGRVLPGYDFFNEDSIPEDNHGHGTLVSGVIAANTNHTGVAGINFQTKILPVKVAEQERVSDSAFLKGIYYAMDQQVDVMNLSFAGPSLNLAIQEALLEAYNQGIVIVASAGNDGNNQPLYPASYPWVISVASTGVNDLPSSFSNYGGWIDIAAPGEDIITTWPNGKYIVATGTSLSAPIVSGISSLLIAVNPAWFPAQIEYSMQKSAIRNSGSEWNEFVGYGRVDAYRALEVIVPVPNFTPKMISSDEVFSATLGLPMERDVYKLDVGANGEIKILLRGIPSTLDLIGILQKKDLDGTLVTLEEFDFQGKGGAETFTYPVQTEEYYFSVYEKYNHWSESPYQVVANFPQAVAASALEEGTVARISGKTRINTAVEISKIGWPSGSTNVVIATAGNFPGALAGAPLAHQLGAPILLTNKDHLSSATATELARLNAKNVIVIGGPVSISAQVEEDLKGLGVNVQRIAGQTRSDSARLIALEMEKRSGIKPSKAIVVYDNNFPDALSIAPYAARNGYPILFTGKNLLPTETSEYLKGISETLVIGGTGVISNSVFNQLPNPVRIGGANRYETMAMIVQKLMPASENAFVATGESFADALTGSVLAAKRNVPLLLVSTNKVPSETSLVIAEKDVRNFTIFGGTVAVSDSVVTELKGE